MSKLITGVVAAWALCVSHTVHAAAMHGIYHADNGWSGATIAAFESTIEKDLAIVQVYTNFDYDWDTLFHQTNNIVGQGARAMITWEPTIASRPNDNLLNEIAQGHWDAYIDDWVADFLAWINMHGDPEMRVLIRFAHEFNGIWYPWANDPTGLVTAWQHIHDRFEAAGANQYVEWVWSANNVDVDDYNDITLYYPGDDYVDWTSIDGYNWGTNYSFSAWRSFSEVFGEKYDLLTAAYPDKPIMIAEVASAEPSDIPDPAKGQDGDNSDAHESKAAWIEDMLEQLPIAFPAVRGFAWFNTNKELSWALNEAPHNSGLVEYGVGVYDSYYLDAFEPLYPTYAAQSSGSSSAGLSSPASVAPRLLRGHGDRERREHVSFRPSLDDEANGFRKLTKRVIKSRRMARHAAIATAHRVSVGSTRANRRVRR